MGGEKNKKITSLGGKGKKKVPYNPVGNPSFGPQTFGREVNAPKKENLKWKLNVLLKKGGRKMG